MAATLFEPPPNVRKNQPPQNQPPPASSAAMSPEKYARLAHATHAAPSVMRERVHRELGIRDEIHRAEIDRAMMACFNADSVAYQLYMQWVSYLRSGGR